jgi:chemotaxis receptor (MCP) glutamine deamidase CheD
VHAEGDSMQCLPVWQDSENQESGRQAGRHSRSGVLPVAPSALHHRRISIGEIRASSSPEMVRTLLGSCVAVCLHDPVTRMGGMNHILLPAGSDREKAPRFGVHAMELLINALMKLGANRSTLVAKAFGGANVLACLRPPTVGDLNVQFVRGFLEAEGIPLLAQRLGGLAPVEVRFRTDTGQAFVHSVNGLPLSAILVEEERFGRRSCTQMAPPAATIF